MCIHHMCARCSEVKESVESPRTRVTFMHHQMDAGNQAQVLYEGNKCS